MLNRPCQRVHQLKIGAPGLSRVVTHTLEDGRLQAHLSEHSDWKLFNVIASTVTERFGGSWVMCADGLDQRYWDVKATAAVHEIIGGLLMWFALNEPNGGRIVAWDDVVECSIVPPLIGLGGKRKVVFTPVLLGET